MHIPLAAFLPIFVVSLGYLWLTLLVASLIILNIVDLDLRFGFITACSGLAGMAGGLAAYTQLSTKHPRMSGGMWLAASCLAAAVVVASSAIAPIGTAGLFLFATIVSVFPFLLWSTGAACLVDEYRSAPTVIVSSISGMVIGTVLCLPVLNWLGSPLRMAWASAAALAISTLVLSHSARTLAISASCLALLGGLGAYINWDFSLPPRWAHSQEAHAKPAYAKTVFETSAARMEIQWDGALRVDVLEHKAASNDLLWIYTNGTFSGLIPAEHPGATDSEWLKNNFPLISLPLIAGKPKKILIINPGGALEARIATDMGIPQIIVLETNTAMKAIYERQRDYHGNLQTKPGVTFIYGDTRNVLRRDMNRYDQIYLTIPQKQIPGWSETGMMNAFLYTRDAFKEYWKHLEPGGMLIILAGEEKLYTRALLTAWETLDNVADRRISSFVQQSWGYQSMAMDPLMRPHQYLLILSSNQPAAGMDETIRASAKNMRVTGLFGPGMTPGASFNILYQPFDILYRLEGLDFARAALARAMSWHLQAPADLEATTGNRPFFFQIIRDMHPFLKWLLAACVTMLAYIFLFPLSRERRPAGNGTVTHPPLPVYLSYFTALIAGVVLAGLATIYQTAIFAGHAGYSTIAVTAGALSGAGIGSVIWLQWPHVIHRQWSWIVITCITVLAVEGWGIAHMARILADWPAVWRLMIISMVSLPIGFFASILIASGMKITSESIKALVPWAWAATGIMAMAGTVSGLWIAQLWGWTMVWWTIIGCYTAVLGLGIWLRWSLAATAANTAPSHVS